MVEWSDAIITCSAVSQHYISYAASAATQHLPSRRPSSSHLSLLLVHSRLDYGKGTLVGLPPYLIHWLQSVQNAAARLIFQIRHSDHITDTLVSLHWLRLPERIVFKVAVQTYRALHTDAPLYLHQFTRNADTPSQRRLRSSTTNSLFQTFYCWSLHLFCCWCMCIEQFAFGHYLLTFKQRLKCTYSVTPTLVLLFNCSSPLWFLK